MSQEVVEQTFEFVWDAVLEHFVRVTNADDWEKDPDRYPGQIVRITTGPKIGVMTDVRFGQATYGMINRLEDLVFRFHQRYYNYGESDTYLLKMNYVYGPPKVIQAKEIVHE